jgi:hypothetical protein
MPSPPGRGSATTAPPTPNPPLPDPFEDADALDELVDEIATLAAHIRARSAFPK